MDFSVALSESLYPEIPEDKKTKVDWMMDAKKNSYESTGDKDLAKDATSELNAMIFTTKLWVKDGEKYQKPNLLVRALNAFRNLYTKFIYKYRMLERNNNFEYKNKNIFKRIMYRLTMMIDKLAYKLQKILDRRGLTQLSKKDKLNYAMDRAFHNDTSDIKFKDEDDNRNISNMVGYAFDKSGYKTTVNNVRDFYGKEYRQKG